MLAKQLGLLRRGAGFTQVQLAEKLGVTKQSVSNWENDNIMPSVEMLCKIADLFHVSTDFLLGRPAPSPQPGALIDATGLSAAHVEHIRLLVEDLRGL